MAKAERAQRENARTKGGLGLISGVRAAARYFAGAVRHGSVEIRKDKAPQVAAALTYHTLFSLLPTLALILVVLRTFVGPAEQEAFKDFVVDSALDWLVVAGPEANGGPNEILGEPAASASEFDATIARIDESVSGIIDRLANINFQGIGVIGVFVFLYASTGLLATIEQSFNQIYGAPQSRPWHVRLPLYYTTLTLAPLMIIAGQLFQSRVVGGLVDSPFTAWLGPPMAVALPTLTTWIVFYLMYVLIPNTKVNLRSAAIGSLIAAFGWVALLELFSFYVDIYAGKSLYGALALLPLGLMWMWLNWLIVLFGLEVSYVLHTVPREHTYGPGKRTLDAFELCDPRWLVTILASVAEHFEAGRSAAIEDIAHRMRVPEPTVRILTEHLADNGFLHRVSSGDADEPDTYALARPPSEIRINELYALWSSVVDAGDHDIPGRDVIARMEAARSEAFASLSLGKTG
ncbi:MAG: YhjD/YihY/BrkB family envelope integrity protein [Maricaulaceae bacterium]|jgi:membrane protein